MIRVILADDHQLFLDGIKSILETEQRISIVDEVNNGLELLDSVKKHLPDVVLTDIRMPVMDGITATRHISKEFPDVKVLTLTMFDEEQDIIEMLKAGASGYLLKKAGKKELTKAIFALYEKKSYYSPSIANKVKSKAQETNYRENHSRLTRREREVLILLAKGKTSQQIAQKLNLSKYTIDTHRKNIHKKLGIESNTGLVRYALKYLPDF